jgi:hypothetical protein
VREWKNISLYQEKIDFLSKNIMPFDDKKPKKNKVGLKLDNTASSIPQPQANQAAVFEKNANDAFNKQESYKSRMLDLSTKFKAMIEDKVLVENKSIISKDLESEVVDKLIIVASEMNTDDNQPEGLGAVALSTLLMKMVILQRNTINSILYKIDRLEKSCKKLEAVNITPDVKKGE